MSQPPLEQRPPDLLRDQHLPPPPRQARSREKRDAILAAALRLFAAQGYEETSVDALTRAAGVAVGAFYQHFASKRQLLLVLMDQLLAQAATLTDASGAAGLPGDIRQAITAQVRQGLRVDWDYSGALRAWHEAAVQDRDLRALNAQIEGWTAYLLAQMLTALAAVPGARVDVDITTFAWLLSLLFWRLAETPLADPEAVIATLTDIIYRMLFTGAE